MILKISIHDNDFDHVMSDFCRDIGMGWFSPKDPKPKDKDLLCEWHIHCNSDRNFLWDAMKKASDDLSKEDKERVARIVTDSFAVFTNAKFSGDAGYLQKNFSCEVVGSVTDKWANGEDYYVFPSSYGDKVLCF